MRLDGTYAGVVELTDDPEKVGRVKVRVPGVHGPIDAGGVGTADLQWALPAGLPAGGSAESGAICWLPNVGDRVWVRFLDGEPEKPIWEWANQTLEQASAYPVWRRQPGGYDGDTAPRSAFITRYGHSIDIQPDEFMFRTAKGYKLKFIDSLAELDLYVPNLIALIGKLLVTGNDFEFNASGPVKVTAASLSTKANTTDIEAMTNTVKAILRNKLVSPLVELGPEGAATDPVVRLSDLVAVVNAIVQQHNSHQHIGNLGKPTSPPTRPMVVIPTASEVTFSA